MTDRPARGRRLATATGVVLLAGLALYTLCCFAARRWWVAELAANWRWHAGLAGLVPAAILLLARRRALALVALGLVGFHVAPALLLHLGAPRAADGPRLRVASANVLWRTGSDAALREWLERERFDLVALQELDRDRLPLLDALRAIYPHQVRWPEARAEWYPGTWGQALLSRHPIERSAIHRGDWAGQPFLEARVRWNGVDVVAVGAHPMRPGRARRIAAREAAYAAIAEAVRGQPHAVVMGDLNATLYSPSFRDLLEAGALSDSRRGFGRQGSWIANYPLRGRVVAPGARLDLDHVLVGEGFTVLERELGPQLGSDHIPVRADLALAAGSH